MGFDILIDCLFLCYFAERQEFTTVVLMELIKRNPFEFDFIQTFFSSGKFVLSLAYSPDGKYIASGAIEGFINIFDITTGKLIHTFEGHAMPIRSLCFTPGLLDFKFSILK